MKKIVSCIIIFLISIKVFSQKNEITGKVKSTYSNAFGDKNGPASITFDINYRVIPAYGNLYAGYKASVWSTSQEVIYFYKGKTYMSNMIPELRNVKIKSVSGILEVYNPSLNPPRITKNVEIFIGGYLDNSGLAGGNNTEVSSNIPKNWADSDTKVDFTAKSISFDGGDAHAAIERYLRKQKEEESKNIKKEEPEKTVQNQKSSGKKQKSISKSPASDDDFRNDKSPVQSSNKTTSKAETAAEKKARKDKEYIGKINGIMEEGEKRREESNRKMDAWQNNFNTTFYAQQNARSLRENIEENSSLSGNYSSVEELERDFNQKYSSINQSVNEWKEAADESVKQGANLLFNNGTASGQAIGEFAGLAASLFNNGEKQKREAREKLEKQRRQYLLEFETKRKAALLELRQKLFSEFPDGGTPLSRHNIKQPEVYCFAYYFNQNDMEADKPEIYITNVYPVAQYSDGTWPFKNSLVNEIKARTKTPQITLMGYYTQKDLADKMRQSLINLSAKAEMKTVGIEYKGKAADKTNKTSSGDFWETGKTAPKKETTKTKTDDFWNN